MSSLVLYRPPETTIPSSSRARFYLDVLPVMPLRVGRTASDEAEQLPGHDRLPEEWRRFFRDGTLRQLCSQVFVQRMTRDFLARSREGEVMPPQVAGNFLAERLNNNGGALIANFGFVKQELGKEELAAEDLKRVFGRYPDFLEDLGPVVAVVKDLLVYLGFKVYASDSSIFEAFWHHAHLIRGMISELVQFIALYHEAMESHS